MQSCCLASIGIRACSVSCLLLSLDARLLLILLSLSSREVSPLSGCHLNASAMAGNLPARGVLRSAPPVNGTAPKRVRADPGAASRGGGVSIGASTPGPFGTAGLGGPIVAGHAVFPNTPTVEIGSSDETKRVFELDEVSLGRHELPSAVE